MGTSFINFDNFGYWTRDGWIEDWLAILVRQFDGAENLTEPQRAMRDHFELQSRGYFNGFVHPCLDEHVTDQTKDWLIENSRLALADHKNSANPDDKVTECAEKWIALLTGEFEVKETAWTGDIHADGAKSYPKPDGTL